MAGSNSRSMLMGGNEPTLTSYIYGSISGWERTGAENVLLNIGFGYDIFQAYWIETG